MNLLMRFSSLAPILLVGCLYAVLPRAAAAVEPQLPAAHVAGYVAAHVADVAPAVSAQTAAYYYYRGRRYPYRYHGAYFGHRYYSHGRYHYY